MGEASAAYVSPLLDLLFEDPGVGRCLVAPDGSVLRANREWLRATGFSLDQALGADIVELFPETREMALAMHARGRAGHHVDVPRHAEHVNGRETWWEGSIDPVPMQGGTGLLIALHEVAVRGASERVEAQPSGAIGRGALEAPLRGFIDAIGDAIQVGELVRDEQGKATDVLMLDVNAAYEKHTGLARDRVVGRRIRELLPVVEPVWLARYEALVRAGRPVHFSERNASLDRWFEVSASPLGGDRFLALFRDVTAQRRTEEALRQSEETLEAFFAGSPGILNLDDDEFRYLKTDATTPTYFGLTRDTIVGKAVEDLAPDFMREFGPMMRRVIETGQPEQRQVSSPVPSRPGEMAYWQASYFPVPLPGGKRGIGIVGVEITELKKTEAALRESEDRFRTLANNMSQLAWMTDEKGWIFWYNKRWFDYTGTTLEEMQGWGWQKVHHPDHLEAVVEKWRRGLASGVEWEDTFPLRSKAGEYRWFLSRAMPIRGVDGKVVRWFGTNTDVTEQREAEQALREAARRKDEFLAVLSHELRNPLAPIRNSIALLDRAAPGSEQAARAREILRRQTDHITRLIDDLLDVTRISRGKINLHRTRMDLRETVQRTADDLRPLFDQAQVELRVESPAGALWLDADVTRIAQVVSNLLHNAVKFTPAGGAVHVAMEANDGRAELSVRDDGIGIEPAQLERMFEPFAQAEQSMARTQGGLGLGLALAKGIVDLHGGTIRAHSDGLGLGAAFVIALPLSTAEEARDGAAPTEVARAPRDILVIEDSEDAGRTLADLLELEGHRVRVAVDGRSGLALARERRPDVVLCDVGLPDMTGYDVARAIRADETLRRSRLIALTGYAQPTDRLRAAEAGFDAHLPKPPPLEDLAELLASEE